MSMKKKLWYEAPEAEDLDIRLEACILLSVQTEDNDDLDLDDPVQDNPW